MKKKYFFLLFQRQFLFMSVFFCYFVLGEQAHSSQNLCHSYFNMIKPVAFTSEENMVNYEVRKSIIESLSKGSAPIVVFDIDGVVYTTQSRILAILKRYDSLNGTRFFENATVDNINPDASFSFIKSAVAKQEFHRTKKDKIIEDIISYFNRERNMDYNFDHDIAYDKVQRLISEYRDLGARVVLISERLSRTKNKTKFLLRRDGIFYDELILRESGIQPNDFKISSIDGLMSRRDATLVAVFDDVFQMHHQIADMGFGGLLQVLLKTNFAEKSFRFYVPLP